MMTSRGESGGGPLISVANARGGRRWQERVIGAGEKDRQGFGPFGELGGEDLGDHSAHRCPDDVGVLDVQECRGIVGHVFQGVQRFAGPAQPGADQPREQRRSGDLLFGFAGQADIAVVIANDTQTVCAEHFAEFGPPQQQLGAQAIR